MSRLNRTQAFLLDLSGELAAGARQELVGEILKNPESRQEYEAMRLQLAFLQSLSIPEPSAAQRREIPRSIKQAVRGALWQRKEAGRRQTLIRCAVGVLVLAAGMAFWGMAVASRDVALAQESAQVAQINGKVRRSAVRLAPAGEQYVLPASINLRQGVAAVDTSDGPTLATGGDAAGFAGGSGTGDWDEFAARVSTPPADPSSPPGSD
jgi:hypothetical protein